MKHQEKISPAEQRVLWISRVVVWIVIVLVVFPALWIVMSSFSAGDSFFLSGEIQYGTLCEPLYGNQFPALGL